MSGLDGIERENQLPASSVCEKVMSENDVVVQSEAFSHDKITSQAIEDTALGPLALDQRCSPNHLSLWKFFDHITPYVHFYDMYDTTLVGNEELTTTAIEMSHT